MGTSFLFNTNGAIRLRIAITHKAMAIGESNKTLHSPPESAIALRRLFSMIGPRTSPRITGANGKSNFLIKYPTTPNPVIMTRSRLLPLTA